MRAGDENANGKDRRESDHSEAARTSGYGRGRDVHRRACCLARSVFMLTLAGQGRRSLRPLGNVQHMIGGRGELWWVCP